MGYERKPDRFPSPLFLFALGRLDARSFGNHAERCHIKCVMKALWMDPGVPELAALSATTADGKRITKEPIARGARVQPSPGSSWTAFDRPFGAPPVP